MEEFAIFVFDAYYINLCVKFDDFFPNSERKKKTIHASIKKKKSPSGTHQIRIFTSLKNLFSDVIKIEILFHKFWRICAIFTYSLRVKNLCGATLRRPISIHNFYTCMKFIYFTTYYFLYVLIYHCWLWQTVCMRRFFLFPGVYKKMRAEEARLSENNHEMEKVKQQHFIQEDKVWSNWHFSVEPLLLS